MNQSVFRFVVDELEQPRADRYLSEQLPEISRSQIKGIIDAGNVTLDGIVLEKAGTKLKRGSVLEILIFEDNEDGLVPEDLPIDILYENDHVIVVNKPAGMVVHPGAGNHRGTLVNALLDYFPPIREVGEVDRPGVVHRLDKETSGVMVFAKTDKAYRWLVKQFKARAVEKSYLALVDGHPPTPTGRIEAPVERDTRFRTRMAVGLRGQGKPAISEYYEVKRFAKHALLEVHPVTGRTHQIRVHLSYIGVPVVGDSLYGRRNPSIPLEGFLLHAKSISLRLPGDRTARSFTAPMPTDFEEILSGLDQHKESSK